MDTRTLQVILEHCIPPAQIKRYITPPPAGGDWYEAAAEEILNETETGMRLSSWLDNESRPQQAKIRGMKVSELRDHLSPEFLEPGKTLGMILWALTSDERLSARNLADHLIEQFGVRQDEEEEPVKARSHKVVTLDQQIAEIDEARNMETLDEETNEDDLNLDELLREIQDEDKTEVEEEDGLDFMDEILDTELEEEEEEEETPASPVEINDELLNEVDSFIASLDSQETDVSVESDEFDDLDELDTQSLIDEAEIETSAEEGEEEFDFDISSEDLGDIELKESEIIPLEEEETHLPVPTVQLGGITISIASLKRACESVFGEPVELVTDESLTRQDQIVVVGRQCGVRIMHGPTWTQPIEPFREQTGEEVTINPTSLKLALSRIYEEPVELIPDPKLLSEGMILFAGKSTGLAIVENQRARVPLPDWAVGIVEEESPDATPNELMEDVALLREQIAMLQTRLDTLEQSPPTPAVRIAEEPLVEEIPEEIEIPETEETTDWDLGHVEDTPISLDEIESEELEPIVGETYFEEDAIDQELMESISAGEEESSEEGLELGEVDLDELNLGEIGDEAEEELDIGEITLGDTDEEAIEEEEPAGEIGDLEELDLSELGSEEEEISLDEIGLEGLGEEENEEGEVGEGEISLDDLDLNALEDYSLGEEEEVEETGEEEVEEEEEESGLEDVDLGDILSELDSEEEDAGGAPEPIFEGESVLLLGGETKNMKEYKRVVKEIGGVCIWYATLSEVPEGEIAGLVEQADVVMTLSAEALSDPGILQAVNYAEEQGKPLIQHHSSSPVSVQKQLVKAMQGN